MTYTPPKELLRRKKISVSLRGKTRTEEHCKNLSLSLIGKKLTLAHRKHLSEAHKGYKPTKAHRKALSLSLIGNTHTKGYKFPKEVGLKRSGEKAWNWKGKNASYNSLHAWIQRQLGKPNYCQSCKTKTAKRFDWANKSGKYKRNLTDWIRLCRKCHQQYDRFNKLTAKKYYVYTSKHFLARRPATD
jgi:hypothetical protein